MSDQITSAVFIVVHSVLIKKKKKKPESKNRKQRRFWETLILKSIMILEY